MFMEASFCPQNSAMITKTVIQETLPIGLRKDDKDPVWGETEGDPAHLTLICCLCLQADVATLMGEGVASAHFLPTRNTAYVDCAHITRNGEEPNQK